MNALTNFRDFGGHQSTVGGTIAKDRLFRCGHLHQISAEQTKSLEALQLTLVIDLRHAQERKHIPVPWPVGNGQILTLADPIAGDAPHKALLRSGPKTARDVDRFYLDFYRDLPFDPGYRDLFTRALLALASHDGRTLVCCAAGKDRTGTLVALIQSLLGAARADVIADYMRSQESIALAAQSAQVIADVERRLGYRLDEAAARQLMSVEPHYIQSAFSSIDERCGSVAAYFEQSGFTAAHRLRLQARLLSRDTP